MFCPGSRLGTVTHRSRRLRKCCWQMRRYTSNCQGSSLSISRHSTPCSSRPSCSHPSCSSHPSVNHTAQQQCRSTSSLLGPGSAAGPTQSMAQAAVLCCGRCVAVHVDAPGKLMRASKLTLHAGKGVPARKQVGTKNPPCSSHPCTQASCSTANKNRRTICIVCVSCALYVLARFEQHTACSNHECRGGWAVGQVCCTGWPRSVLGLP